MASLTININDEALKRACIRALENNTSIDAVLSQYLEQYAQIQDMQRTRQEALQRILQTAKTPHPTKRSNKPWRRNELYER